MTTDNIDARVRGAVGARAARLRRTGYRKVAIQWAIALAATALFFFAYPLVFGPSRTLSYAWDFTILKPYVRSVLSGLGLTLQLTVICLVLSMILGVFVAAARRSDFVPLRMFTAGYIEVMRSTPLLIQLVWIFYALPILTGVTFPSYEAAVLALTVHMAAYFGEAFRAGTQSIPKEYLEAADILGLNAFDRARFVVLPQAVRNVLPVLVTLSLLLLKDTSLVSVLGINDLMNVGTNVALSTFKPLEVLTTVGVVYLLVALPLTILVRKLEVRMAERIV
jgi:polar amino acid transport system permease protein